MVFAAINCFVLLVTIIAIWKSPIKAIKIAQKLQDQKSKNDRLYNNKFSVLAVIVGERHAKGYSSIFITAMNQVPIVFNDNQTVLLKYKTFIKEHKVSTPDNQSKLVQGYLNDLIVEMGKELGYPEMDNEWIELHFYPQAAIYDYDARFYQNLDYLYARSEKIRIQSEQKLDDTHP